MDQRIRVELEQFCESQDTLDNIKLGLFQNELMKSSIKVSPISSGSAVVADADKMIEIGTQQRKMAALEMEMYALYESASQSLSMPYYFGVKGVVDIGNSLKNDNFHTAASILSARFVINFLQDFMPTCDNKESGRVRVY